MNSKKLFVLLLVVAVGTPLFFGKIDFKSNDASAQSNKNWVQKSADAKAPPPDALAFNQTFVELAKSLSPTVVNIYTKTKVQRPQMGRGMPGGPMQGDDLFRFFFGNPFGGGEGFGQPPPEAQSLGSGFVINVDGVIVTNSHVVRMQGRNADSIMVKFLDDPKQSTGHEATVVGVDEGTDVAVIKLKKKKDGIRVAPLGNSDKLQVGEWVMAIGNPYGHSNSVTKGIVSALGRDLEQSRSDFIQTDASINPGNSGGPLFNIYGEVIGINTAIDARAQGIGFAIPVNAAKASIEQLIEKGEVTLGWIGVGIGDLTPDLAESLGLKAASGALIQDVFEGEPADRAGLKSYDVVIEVNGKKITTRREFMIQVGGLKVGSKAEMKVIRDGKTVPISVTVAKRKTEAELAKRFSGGVEDGQPGQDSSSKNAADLGLGLSDLTPELRRRLDVDATVRGVVVMTVLPQGSAANVGIAPGDIITEINRKTVSSVREADAALKGKNKKFLIKIKRRTASIIVLIDNSGE
jgi:serine protease Do